MFESLHQRASLLLPMLLVFGVVLMGAGCAGSSSSDDDFPEFITLPREAGAISAFEGEEGIKTEAAFDAIAEGYNAYLRSKELPAAASVTFNGYVATDGRALQSTDAYGNKIMLLDIDLDSYLLHSAGPDTFPETTDDYYKAYEDGIK